MCRAAKQSYSVRESIYPASVPIGRLARAALTVVCCVVLTLMTAGCSSFGTVASGVQLLNMDTLLKKLDNAVDTQNQIDAIAIICDKYHMLPEDQCLRAKCAAEALQALTKEPVKPPVPGVLR
jgi:Flp pilus assembly protein TadD